MWFFAISVFVMLRCVCGTRWCMWMVVLGRVPISPRHSTHFLSNSNTFLLISNKLLLISGFFTKPNLFLARFFCNFTPILSFFLFSFFCRGDVKVLSYIHRN